MRVLFLIAAILSPAACQLRPRRVGVGSLGEQAGAAAAEGGDSMADLMAKMGAGGQGLEDMMAGLQNNPEVANMMEQMTQDPEAMQAAMAKGMEALMGGSGGGDMMKGLEQMMGANPEVAEMLKDPSKMQEKMAEVMQLMNSDEGKEMQSKMMEEVQSVLSDPEKMRQGLEQFATNPMLKGMADAIPGLKQVLDDPEMMAKQIEEAQSAIAQMGGLEGMQEKMAEMMGGAGADGDANPMAAMLKAMAGGAGGEEGGMGDNSDLQERVREQLAAMLQGRGGDDAPAVDIDEF